MFTSPEKYSGVEARRAKPGTLTIAALDYDEKAVHLVSQHDGEDGDAQPMWTRFEDGPHGFSFSDQFGQSVSYDLAVADWRVEVDSDHITSPFATRTLKGDLVKQDGEVYIAVGGRLGGANAYISLTTFRVDFVKIKPGAILFRSWRVVTDVPGQDDPMILYERKAPQIA